VRIEESQFHTNVNLIIGFGGAGGQHACAIATNLGIHSVLVHRYSSVLSAYGIALAELGTDHTEPSVEFLSADTIKRIEGRRDELKQTAKKNLLRQGVKERDIEYTTFLNLRYEGTDTSLMIREPEDGDYEAAFTQRHLREFSFASNDKRLIVDGEVLGLSESCRPAYARYPGDWNGQGGADVQPILVQGVQRLPFRPHRPAPCCKDNANLL